MYEMEGKNAPMAGLQPQAQLVNPYDRTIRENIDMQIKNHEACIERLMATKRQFEKTGLLDMRIQDVRQAMNF